MRVLIVFLSLDREPWRTLEKAQLETWAQPQDEVEFLYLQGITASWSRSLFLLTRKIAERLHKREYWDSAAGTLGARRQVRREGNVIRTRTWEYWIGTSAKMHAGLRYLVTNYEFDYVVRTNSSTYLHIPALLAHISRASSSGYYAGADQGAEVAQGTCIILSRDLAETLAEDSLWDYDTVDDVAIGMAAQRAGAQFQRVPQLRIDSPQQVGELTDDELGSVFIFRFKTRNQRNEDAVALRLLHQRLHDHSA